MSRLLFLTQLFGPFGLLGVAFWGWMLYDLLKYGNKDRNTWVWVLLIGNVLGAFIYFLVCWLPRNQHRVPTPQFMKRWQMKDALWQAEAEVANIGKAHQYIKLGNILFDMGHVDRAETAYAQALDQEPQNPQALWGAAQVAIKRKKWDLAEPLLATLVKVNPDFAYGDGSLTYAQVLVELGKFEVAETQFQQHLKSWSHPQGYISLAKVQQKQGRIADARKTIETMIIRLKSSPSFQYRKNKHFIQEGERLLKTLR